jgi:5-hydroxyisourate hydrolase-like protein (transthyretin family)
MRRLLVLMTLPAVASACSCAVGAPPCQAAWKAKAVFAGTVVDLTRDVMKPDSHGTVQVNGYLGTHAVFEVTEAFLGMEGRPKRIEIRTGMGGGDCGYPFERGQRYVVYAEREADGALVASLCSRTAPVDRASADLAYLRGLAKTPPSGYVFGIAGSTEGEDRLNETLGIWTPPGVAGVTVMLTGQGKNGRMVTGADGMFRFDSLPPGKYAISVAKEGYAREFGAESLDVPAGGCAFAFERLAVDRRITGHLRTADGQPAANIPVQIVPTRPQHENELPFAVAEARTGADGRYVIPNVRTGEYYLGINLARTPSKEMPYARTFFPGVEDPAAAGIVIVGRGPGVATYDFTIPAPQKQRPISGFVYWPDGRPAEKVSIMLEDIRWPWQTNVVAATTGTDGHFEVSAFLGTAYRIHAISMGRLTTDSVSAEPLPLGPGSDVSKPLRLVLTRNGHSAAELAGKGIERWRAGLGL